MKYDFNLSYSLTSEEKKTTTTEKSTFWQYYYLIFFFLFPNERRVDGKRFDSIHRRDVCGVCLPQWRKKAHSFFFFFLFFTVSTLASVTIHI